MISSLICLSVGPLSSLSARPSNKGRESAAVCEGAKEITEACWTTREK
jgi:hypothetical protein